ncbi:hypothetical protein EZS27_031738 [termite gut metagenome]|uniref:Uncharacterized protein n=1 Tax=termite gut metagenome TaxID=433724 RepID=A0A5J4QAV8_9ZZZZ
MNSLIIFNQTRIKYCSVKYKCCSYIPRICSISKRSQLSSKFISFIISITGLSCIIIVLLMFNILFILIQILDVFIIIFNIKCIFILFILFILKNVSFNPRILQNKISTCISQIYIIIYSCITSSNSHNPIPSYTWSYSWIVSG